MSTPGIKGKFPRLFDGQMLSLPAICDLTGISRYHVSRAIVADDSIHTTDALKAAVRAYQSGPNRLSHKPGRHSQQWNGCNRLRALCKADNKPRTKSTKP